MSKRARFPEFLHGHQDPRPDQLQRTGYDKPKKKKKHELIAQLSREIAACIVCDRPITQVVEELLAELGYPLDYEASDKLRDVRLYVAGLLDEVEFMGQMPEQHRIQVVGPFRSAGTARQYARTMSSDPDEAVVVPIVHPRGRNVYS